jgi:subtilisin family serine protease
LPVFAAGNSGPSAATGVYPGTYPEAFPVGSSDRLDRIDSSSSRGPNTCISPTTIYPAMVAPGTDIKLAAPGGGTTVNSGTSFAAPHVAGALALLLSALSPQGLSLDQQAAALLNSALDLGAAGADNAYGAGRLDVWAAYQQVNAAQVGFSVTSQTVSEGAGVVLIEVTRAGGLALPQVSVDYSLASAGAAQADVDFQFSPGRLVFLAGETRQSFPITILRDGQPGADKTLILQLSNPGVATLDAASTQMALNIREIDPWKVYFPLIQQDPIP